MKKIFTILLILQLFVVGCVHNLYNLKHEGVRVEIVNNKNRLQGELLSLNKENVIIKNEDKIYRVLLKNNKKFIVFETHGNVPKNTLVTTLFIGTTLATLKVFFIFGGVFFILFGLEYIMSLSGDNEKVIYLLPLSNEDVIQIMKYSRFPFDYTDEQWEMYLKLYNQEDFIEL